MMAVSLWMGAAGWSAGGEAPQPARPWMDASEPPSVRADKLLHAMTVEEKLSLFHGSCSGYVGNVCANTRLGIPAIRMNDGPQGFRDNARPGTSTAFPCGLAIAATFDIDASSAWGVAMGDEFFRKGANVQLGPGVCVARVPRNGRNFEYLSGEDPYLGYTLVQPAVVGIQSQGVIANAKHWVNNNQETNRTSVSAVVDERTQFEMYYPPFEGAIAAGVGSFMCSYNKIRGVWSCENGETLRRDLKTRLGFKGWVMSDWGATHSSSINEGLDQEMPGDWFLSNEKLAALLAAGNVSLATVDDSARRILQPMFAARLFDVPNKNTQANNVTSVAHNGIARDLAARSIVLLKNEGVLPLSADKGIKIALIGKEAKEPTVHGGGSGQVVPYYTSSPFDAIRAKLGLLPAPPAPNNCSDDDFEAGVDFRNTDDQTFAPAADEKECCQLCAARNAASSSVAPCLYFTFAPPAKTCWMKSTDNGRTADPYAISGSCHAHPPPPPPECTPDGTKCVYFADGSDAAAAAALAAAADVALVFAATFSSEGADRASLSLDGNADALVRAVAARARKTAVCVSVPGAVLTPWREEVHALTAAFMPGQEYGNALADVLFGSTNPSAKLPLTFPTKENEVNFNASEWPGVDNVGVYYERLLIGYRYYDAAGIKPAFAFGHGLSYTTFALANLSVATDQVSFSLANTGRVKGAETPQLYLGFPPAAGEPPQQLKGFTKVELAAGAARRLTFPITPRDRSIWDVGSTTWVEVKGRFTVTVGTSSRDPKALTGSFII